VQPHGWSAVENINLGNPSKPKRTRKPSSTQTVVDQDEVFNLQIFSQNIRGLGKKN
jgi:hypothetical protein